jgi:hypothetical protein
MSKKIVNKLFHKKINKLKGDFEFEYLTDTQTNIFRGTDDDIVDLVNSITFFEDMKKKNPTSPIDKKLNKLYQKKIESLTEMLGTVPQMNLFKNHLLGK